jgi:hypothetical protein
MFTMVFSNEDKQKLLASGAKFIGEQKLGNDIVYLFSGKININFEESKIKYAKTNDIIL